MDAGINGTFRGGIPRILAVGGDTEGARALRRSIRAAGYRNVTVSTDGMHAVLMAMKWLPQVAVVETSITGMSAYEVAERLQNLPVGSPIPVILVAWESDGAAKLQASMVGAAGVLEMPYEPQELARLLREALLCVPTA